MNHLARTWISLVEEARHPETLMPTMTFVCAWQKKHSVFEANGRRFPALRVEHGWQTILDLQMILRWWLRIQALDLMISDELDEFHQRDWRSKSHGVLEILQIALEHGNHL